MENDDQIESQPIRKNHQKSTDGKLLIKLKFPKMEEGGVMEEDPSPRPEGKDQIRVCLECCKEFSSGKALGGHMRIHVQANKEVSQNKLKPKPIGLKKQPPPEADFKSSSNVEADNSGKPKPICRVCGKDFRSMKSLFGHMRCHPEREWRGIQPPATAKTSPSSSVSDGVPQKTIDSSKPKPSVAVDLTQSLPGWSVTARRGRQAIATSSGFSSSDDDEQLQDAVYDLMRLAHLDSFESGLTQKQKVDEFEDTNSNSLTYKAEIEDTNRVTGSTKRRIEEFPEDYGVKRLRIDETRFSDSGNVGGGFSNSTMIVDKGKGKGVLDSGSVPASMDCHWPKEYDHSNCSDDESGSRNTEQMINYKYRASTNEKTVTVIKNKKKRKMKLMMDLELAQNVSPVRQMPLAMVTKTTPDKYRCSTCNKCFPSHQALGGHRSSHNKFKATAINAIDESSSAAAEEGKYQGNFITRVEEIKESEGAASSKLLLVESTHQCKICNRIFPTGQALGGHKRCHWTGPLETPSSQVTSPGEASQTGRKIMEFDLNEAPPMEDEGGIESEHAAGYGYGYASSSYNSNIA